MYRALLVAFVFLVIVAAVAVDLYASGHPRQTRAAMEALRIWPTLTPTASPTPRPTPTPTPMPTAIPSPTATLLPARRRPRLAPNGAPGAGVGLQRPAHRSARVEWYDPGTGIDVTLRWADVKPAPTRLNAHRQPMQYLRIAGEEQYFGNDILLSTPWRFELRDQSGHAILPDPRATHWPILNVPNSRRNVGRLVFTVPAAERKYSVYWDGDDFWARIATVAVHGHAPPRLVQSAAP